MEVEVDGKRLFGFLVGMAIVVFVLVFTMAHASVELFAMVLGICVIVSIAVYGHIMDKSTS